MKGSASRHLAVAGTERGKLPQPPAFYSESSYFSPPNNVKSAAKQPRRIKAGVLLLTELWEGWNRTG